MTPEEPDDLDGLDPELIEALLCSLTPIDPPPALRARVLNRTSPPLESPGPVVTVRASEGTWVDFLPGIRVKALHDDGASRTWLARMEAGAVVPAHEHERDEECLVLEGTIVLGGVELHVGDHQVAKAGSWHDAVTTRTGCLVLLKTGSVDRGLAALCN